MSITVCWSVQLILFCRVLFFYPFWDILIQCHPFWCSYLLNFITAKASFTVYGFDMVNLDAFILSCNDKGFWLLLLLLITLILFVTFMFSLWLICCYSRCYWYLCFWCAWKLLQLSVLCQVFFSMKTRNVCKKIRFFFFI